MTLEDLDALEEMGREFFSKTDLPGTYSPRLVRAFLIELISGRGVVFVAEKDAQIFGAIGGIIVPDMFTGAITTSETFWFVTPNINPRAAIILLYELEEWSKAIGAVAHYQMSLSDSSFNDTLKELYSRRGYKPVEQHFRRVWLLQPQLS